MRKAKLQIEGSNGVITIDGWADETNSWNGWSYVLMDKENALKLVSEMPEVLRYDESKDEVVEVFNKDYHESEEELLHWTINLNEELQEQVFSVGSGYWCWNHEFFSEFNNMHEALRAFLNATNELQDNWDNEYPTVYKDRKYPEYLPSFDEFIGDMYQMVIHDTDPRLHEWRKTIQ
jgi:hypothetical protein